MKFRYTLIGKMLFYWSYFSSKFFLLWFEVEQPKLLLFIYELLYSSKKFLHPQSLMPSPFNIDFVVTKYGKYHIRPGTTDLSVVSPAFERLDMKFLMKLTRRLRSEGKSILCFDCGANLGVFSILIGNLHKDYGLLHIVACEPEDSNYMLLQRNINENNLRNVESYQVALFSEDNREMCLQSELKFPGSSFLKACKDSFPGNQKISAVTLDTLMGQRFVPYDVIIFKMDVEGAETDILRGAQNILNSGKEIWIMVEDFVDPGIIGYLNGIGAEFATKLTPYNSWWRYQRKGSPQ